MRDTIDSTRLDVVFGVLSNPYRRRILVELYDQDSRDGNAFSVEEFATDHEDPDELRIELYHCHLPKLATNGYIEWDPDAGTIRWGPNFDEVALFIATMLEYENRLSAECA